MTDRRAIIRGNVLDQLACRAGPGVPLGAIAKRDLERYYGLLAWVRVRAHVSPLAIPPIGARVIDLADLDDMERKHLTTA